MLLEIFGIVCLVVAVVGFFVAFLGLAGVAEDGGYGGDAWKPEMPWLITGLVMLIGGLAVAIPTVIV